MIVPARLSTKDQSHFPGCASVQCCADTYVASRAATDLPAAGADRRSTARRINPHKDGHHQRIDGAASAANCRADHSSVRNWRRNNLPQKNNPTYLIRRRFCLIYF